MSPQILEDAFNRYDFDRDLAFKFFVGFSMFEHALKEVGFRQVDQNGDIHPDWTAFTRSINDQFNPNSTPELSIAVNYLLNQPTKKQVFRSNHIIFILTPRPQRISDTEWLSVLIRRVRNNLFHGGKINYKRPRDTLLIQFSLLILDSWADCHPGVEQDLRNIH